MQWERIYLDKQAIDIDRVIDRISKKNIEKLSKLEIMFQFPNLYPGTKTVIVLKQPKTEGSIRVVESTKIVLDALIVLKELHDKLKQELGSDGYMNYDLVICQANGRPIMTEHLNKRFKDILAEMNDPEIDPEEIVFHSLRHTSASTKLTISNGDYNSVKHAGGWANLEMLTRRYGAHSFESDRDRLNQKMDTFLGGKAGQKAEEETTPADTKKAIEMLAQTDPALLMEIVKSIQLANKA